MPAGITLASAVEKARLESDVPYLVLIELQVIDDSKTLRNTIRAVRSNEGYTFKGETFLPAIFDVIPVEESGRLASASLRITDFTRAIRQQEEQYGGPTNFQVRIMVINSDQPNENPEIDLVYGITGSSANEFEISYTLGGENILQAPFPHSKQYKDRCRFRYKGLDCGYSGPIPTCDLSFDGPNGCAQKNNTLRYGGFPGLS